MTQFTVGILEAQQWVFRSLQVLLGSGIQVLRIQESDNSNPGPPGISLFVVGNSLDNPLGALFLIQRLRRARPRMPIFMLAWASSEKLAIAALKEGITDYFSPPIELSDVAAAVRRCLAPPEAPERDAHAGALETRGRPIVGGGAQMQSVRDRVVRVAQRDCNVLVLGETGTGKDLIAEAIHANSPRRAKPFVSVNCAAIPDTLLESELFGHERGAFTGANAASDGRIQQARDGTIFFDEIGDMTPYAQAKILRVIEGGQIQRLGGKASVPVNVRVIAATNQDLPKLVSEQRFRKDLYFRLNVAQLHLPPLRERREDIPALLEHYLNMFHRQTEMPVEGFTAEALEWLLRYDWPGNIRELKNLMESVFVDPPYPRIDLCHLDPGARANGKERLPGERDQLLQALESTQWNKSKAAEKLRWSRMKIYRKLAKYGI